MSGKKEVLIVSAGRGMDMAALGATNGLNLLICTLAGGFTLNTG
jgi:hypothetical protein